ncbi:MAG: tRNA (guanosine(46)-N7)-methyltransferase TrmB [Paludibacter sp.]|nr:tRNA (guanosine(46)-N7)-methyltransferase TrmB [Bacteroidales bacterium]MCM1068593.1 tRNA (guanosine(46)-N7)-methyltransferase TrmB [Prevotella sp.]MCM1353257.1 tRNA (guanosine(46)-N7)-methyltransferase TrmB [Bacteroides sp.]MCM1442335.1 tRNA (guanosine(46)-N7)-methyltransferase TrmB [Muribaculum sp.]MCM1481154.1 tRNA (guanosine(46)-N7)-methyltransferase TrmB [Paludibacter sp.]
MGKNKLRKFAEMETLPNVFQCGARDADAVAAMATMAGKWKSSYFKNTNPIVIELGCGRGEYTVGLARMFPEKNFIGVDIKGARMWAGATEAHNTNLTNVAFLRTNIELLPHFFAANEVDEIWITFPDPQMKKATKRLTSSFFMQRYQQCVKDGGLIHLKTDSPFLYQYTCEMVKVNAYETVFSTDNLYASDWADEIRSLKTHYEKQWLERGMTIKYIQFRLTKKTDFVEPDVEIEYDNYRSYGRTQRPSQGTTKQ